MFGKRLVLSYIWVLCKMTGKTEDTSQFLSCDHFPTYLELGKKYQVIKSECRGIIVPSGDPDYMYMIQDKCGQGEVFFLRSCFTLPKIFWVRGLTAFNTVYEILPEEYDGEPFQVQLARKGSPEVAGA